MNKLAKWNSLPKTIAKRIEEMVEEQQERSDSQIPSQRELASRFGVSRTSIREALSMLEVSGRLRIEPGRGSFWIGDGSPEKQTHKGLTEATPDSTLLRHQTYPKAEISRLRYLIEGQSARLTAMRISDDEVQQLVRVQAAFTEQTRVVDLQSSSKTDFEFHQLITEFSGVRLFADLHLAFRDIIMQVVQMYQSQYTRAWEPVAEHEKIIEALRRRDPNEALYYMQSHIVRSADRLGLVDANEIL